MTDPQSPVVPNTPAINTLTDSEKLPGSGDGRWSRRLAERYGCELSDDLADWFDSRIWQQIGTAEYREPVDPAALLVDAPEPIWPGLMPSDLLPISGNMAGDWLCIRVGSDNRASQVVQWYHGGGDWLPWGKSFAEAILFDRLSVRLPGPSRRYAIAAEEIRAGDSAAGDAHSEWACRHVDPDVARLVASDADGETVASELLKHQVSEVAVRCELVQSALKETLSATLDPETARQLGVDWNEVVQWMFDTERIPDATRRRLERDYGLTISKPQDWQAAQAHCLRVVEIAPELAWAWDVIGYAAERDNDSAAALEAYVRAASCSVFTDQSVRIRTHWAADAAKFSASRIREIDSERIEQSEYLSILCGEESARQRSLTSHWLSEADLAAARGDHEAAYRCCYSAGWDLGADPMSVYAPLLERIAEHAELAGQTARAELARTHRNCLRERYGI